MATVRHESRTTENGSTKCPLIKKKPPTRQGHLPDGALESMGVVNLEDWQLLSVFLEVLTYGVLIFMGLDVRTQRTAAHLLDTCAGPNLVKNLFFLPNWQTHFSPAKAPPLKAAHKKAFPVEGSISLHTFIGDFYAHLWFSIVGQPAMGLLCRTSFNDRCILCIFQTEQKVVPIHFSHLAIRTLLLKVPCPLAEDFRDDTYLTRSGNTMMFLCHVARPRTI